jgi:hypothetical protein
MIEKTIVIFNLRKIVFARVLPQSFVTPGYFLLDVITANERTL